jgi:hypothetical protein
MATHAIFALTAGTDELTLALKAGADLAAKGHDVWLHGRPETADAAAVEGIPFHAVDAEDVAGCIEAIAEENDSVLVVDFLTTFSLLSSAKGALERVQKLGKVVVLDPWNIGEGDRVLDTPFAKRTLGKETLLTKKRLVPSLVRTTSANAFRAYPEKPEGDPAARRAGARRALGVREKERVLLLSTSSLQVESVHDDSKIRQLARRTTRLVVERVAKIENARLLHVGPAPLGWTEPLGDRYTWMVPPGTKHLHNRFAAADAALVLDVTSSAIAWAATWGIPVMALVNGFDVKTATAKFEASFLLTEGTRAWLAESTPLPKFRICPLGLWQTLEPASEPPYFPLELLDETSFLDTCRALLFDEAERARALRDSASCMSDTASLPSAAELWEKLVGTTAESG